MSILVETALAQKVWFDEDNIWVLLTDGRQIGVPLAYYPRLLNATPEQRSVFEVSGNGRGLHWEALDEDLSVQGLVLGTPDRTRHLPA